MRNTIAIVKREILSFFVSPIAYFVITGFVLLAGYFFFNLLLAFNVYLQRYAQFPQYMGGNENFSLNQLVVEGFYHTLLVILVFLVPLLTMRTFAEEKRRGTFELLVTSPLSVTQIVLGKFLSISFVVILMMALVFVFPLFLWLFSTPEVLPMVSGILGLTLCALAFSSISMAVSCLTENQIVAAVCGMVALLLYYVIHSPAESVQGPVGDLLMYLSPVMQVKDMFRGVISLKSSVYFLSVIMVGLFFSQRALEAHRWR